MRVVDDSSACGITLHNDRLLVHVLPEEGGRIASFFDTQSRVEFLLQPPGPYRQPGLSGLWNRFENSACAGIDECLPSVGACGPETRGGPVPDHGDFWRLRWAVSNLGSDTVSLSAFGYSRPLLFEKHLRLRATSLQIHYRICNQADVSIPFLYALHPLLAIDPGDRIVLPSEVSSVRLESSRLHRLGTSGATIAWPRPSGADARLDLSRVQAVSAATAEMFYTSRLQSGWCGLYRAQSGQGLVIRFDPRLLPFLGLWLCYGGWPEDTLRPRQYAIALEPTVAPWGTLTHALEAQQAPALDPQATFEFTILLERIGQVPLTYDEFVRRCSENISK